MSIFVCGALHYDVIVTADRFPRPDETLFGDDVTYRLGGKGGNQAISAAAMGSSVAMAGTIGSDAYAAQMIADLSAGNVDVSQISHYQGASGMSVAIVDQNGDYGAVVISGVNRQITDAITNVTIPDGTNVLLLQNEIPAAANLHLLAMAKAQGVKTVLNAAPYRALSAHMMQEIDIIIVNRPEAQDLLLEQMPSLGDVDIGAMADALALLGPAHLILTAGAGGVYACKDGQVVHYPARPVDVVSSHGAGDAFIGGLAHGLDSGVTLEQAITIGQNVAAEKILGQ